MALPFRLVLVRVRVNIIFEFVNVVNSEQCAGEGGEFTEGDEEGLMDLTLRVDVHAAEEENEPANGEDDVDDDLFPIRRLG